MYNKINVPIILKIKINETPDNKGKPKVYLIILVVLVKLASCIRVNLFIYLKPPNISLNMGFVVNELVFSVHLKHTPFFKVVFLPQMRHLPKV